MADGDISFPDILAADAAHRAAQAGEVLLIDIRTQREWEQTGVAGGALALDMTAPDFEDQFLEAVGADRARPIALICATGGRSGYLAGALRQAGFSSVADVNEGMMGSTSGPGWLAHGLPVAPAPEDQTN